MEGLKDQRRPIERFGGPEDVSQLESLKDLRRLVGGFGGFEETTGGFEGLD